MLESNPPKPTMLVGRLGVRASRRSCIICPQAALREGQGRLVQLSILRIVREVHLFAHKSFKLFTLFDLCASSLRRGHANLLCIVPILTDDPRRESKKFTFLFAVLCSYCLLLLVVVCYCYVFMFGLSNVCVWLLYHIILYHIILYQIASIVCYSIA